MTPVQLDAAALPLGDQAVDLVFCSPPYESARLYDELGFKLEGEAWVAWALPRFLECLRVCRGLVAWVVEGRTRQFRWSAAPVLLAADLHRRGVHLRKPPAFCRVGIPGSGGPDWWRNDYELVICATNGGKLRWSDNTATGHPPKWAPGGEMSHRLRNGDRRNRRGKAATCGVKHGDAATKRQYVPPKRANPGNLVKCVVGGGRMGHPLAHENEAPFPETLVEPFVKCFCPPGGLVLDPFGGSGTTAAVAERLGRRWVMGDIRFSQCEMIRRRVA